MPLWYGGDYNPEQWPHEVWNDDVRLMKRAGVTVATLNVFSWAQLEPRDGQFEFAWLDDIIARLHSAGIRIDLATATASPPAWLSRAHPEILPATAEGVTLWPGSRQHYSASSPVYRRFAARLVRMLAERYGEHPALIAWHVGNEFANDNGRDYGDVAARSFRTWLREKYSTIDVLNEAWGTSFWSQKYADFDEILPPRSTPTFGNPAQLLDFDRFSSDEHLACYLAEVEILRELSPGIPITTNFMGFFKGLDYWEWARHVDFVSDDSYPDPADPQSHLDAAMSRDLMRSLGGGAPWVLMEQATSAVNWRPVNTPKAPGQMRALSFQALARGADGIMFFQWRQSVQGAEKFHSAMLPAQGPEHRIFHEVEALGAELATLPMLEGSRVNGARVAIVFDWQSWWSIEQRATPASVDYIEGIRGWYRELSARGLVVDFARPDADFSAYAVVIVPSLFVADPETLTGLGRYAAAGGTLLVTYLTGITDQSARFSEGGFLGLLAGVLGVRVEEFAPQTTGFAEFVTVFDADVVERFADGPLEGEPLVTQRTHGDGQAMYIAGGLDAEQRHRVLDRVLASAGVRFGAQEGRAGIADDGPHLRRGQAEVVRRGDLVFAINFGSSSARVEVEGKRLIGPQSESGVVDLKQYEVAVWSSPTPQQSSA
jgi:beta-galactosidase